jgi:hypothetical protein
MMNIRKSLPIAVGIALLVAAAGGTLASSDEPYEYRYGYQLMSPEERAEHRNRMRSLETEEAREAYRREQHETMRARAAEEGVILPDEPRARPQGRGQGRGRGPRWDD